jgi:site-specific recombinase XerD
MLTGWRRQQLACNLSISTIHTRAQLVDRFIKYTNEMPWNWTVQHVDEFFGDLRAEHNLARSTVRSYQNALSLFCAYLADPGYGWDTLCEKEFGSHPSQICFEWNTAAHTQDNEQDPTKRAFTRKELQTFFDRADDEVSRIRDLGRKGWVPAFRDAVLFKVAYGWGLRRNEVRHLQTVDFSRNPHAPEFGRHGVLNVRYGKANAGSAHKRRSVLTVMGWTAETAAHWIEKVLPQFGDGLDMFPSERQVPHG